MPHQHSLDPADGEGAALAGGVTISAEAQADLGESDVTAYVEGALRPVPAASSDAIERGSLCAALHFGTTTVRLQGGERETFLDP